MSQRPQQVSGVCLVSEEGEWTLEPRLETWAGDSTGQPCQPHLSSSSLSHPHNSKEAQHMTGLPQHGAGREMKHFWVSELSKHPGCSARPESRERRGAGVARPPPRGMGSLQNVFMQHLGVWGR